MARPIRRQHHIDQSKQETKTAERSIRMAIYDGINQHNLKSCHAQHQKTDFREFWEVDEKLRTILRKLDHNFSFLSLLIIYLCLFKKANRELAQRLPKTRLFFICCEIKSISDDRDVTSF